MADDCQSFRQGLEGDIRDIEVSLDPETNQQVIYWSDILILFPNAHHVKRRNAMVTFVRNGGEWRRPHRIKFYRGDILEVVNGNGSEGHPHTLSTPEPTNHPTTAPILSALPSALETPTPGQVTFSATSFSTDPRLNLESLVLRETAAASATTPATTVATSMVVATSPTQRRVLKRAQTLLLSSSAQLFDYEKASQSSVIAKVDAIVHGNEDIQQGIKVIQVELKENFPALRSEIVKNTALQQELAAVQQEMLRLQKRSIKMQQEALDRLALIQNKVAAIMTQSYELHEYPIPRLFIVLPKEDTTMSETLTRGFKNLFAKQFKLYFLCECGDHTKPSDGRPTNRNLKHEIHIARHEGYDIDRPTEFFEKYGSYILTLLQMLKYGIAIAGVVVPPLTQLKIVDTLADVTEGANHILQDLGPMVDSSIAYIEGLSGEQSQLSPSGPNPSSADSKALSNLEALEGADLRQLESFLKTTDEGRVLGNLYRIVTSQGHVKWVCLDHFRENYRAKATHDLRDAVQEINGEYDETLGRVEARLRTPIAATRFYSVLSSSRFVHELGITFRWTPSMQDLRELRDAVKSTSIVQVALSNSTSESAPLSDILNNNRRSDPLLQLMSGGNIQSLEVGRWCNGFLERVSTVPTTLTVRRLNIRSTENWSKRIPRLISILQASPLLSELTLSALKIDDIMDTLMPALERSKLPQTFNLEITGDNMARVCVEVEANTGKIQSLDLRLESMRQTKLVHHPMVRHIHIVIHRELDPLLEQFKECLKHITGLESVSVSCPSAHFIAWLQAFHTVFAEYPHQTPQFCFSNGKESLRTSNFQARSSAVMDVEHLQIPYGYFDSIPADCTIKAKALVLDSDVTPSDIEALAMLVKDRAEHFQFQVLSINFEAQTDPVIFPTLVKALKECVAFHETRVDLQLHSAGNSRLFSCDSIGDGGKNNSSNSDSTFAENGSLVSFRHLLQHYTDRLFTSQNTLPVGSSSSYSSKLCGPFRRLQVLHVRDLHAVGSEEFAWILAATKRDNSRHASDVPSTTTSTTAATASTPSPAKQLYELLFTCTMTDAQWMEVVRSINILTLKQLLVRSCYGFTNAHLAALVDRCISTTAEILALSLSSTSSYASQLSNDPRLLEDLRNREKQELFIQLSDIDSVSTEHIKHENERLKMNSVDWVRIAWVY